MRGPLFIGGCPRSGTTALVQTFNATPSVHISSEENLLNADKVLRKLLGTRERRAEIYQKGGGSRTLSARETLNTDILSSNFTEKSTFPTLQAIYKWHHSQKNDENLALWGDKLPNYYKDINTILANDDARYVHITRNPFDVINSMLRRTEMAKQGKDWWKSLTEIDDMISAWCEAYNAINCLEDHKNVFHIHYEELVFDFTKTVKSLNDFLGVDLVYKNIMVDTPEKHYDRTYLNRSTINRILERPEVVNYIEKYFQNSITPNVSNALDEIVRMKNNQFDATSKIDTGTIRVFVAATPAEWLPARLLEFSIQEHTEMDVDVQFLYKSGIDIPVPKDINNRPRTPFSFQRFLIPELCAYQGKAIYMDADMQVFQDISGLWNYPLLGTDLLTVKDAKNGRKKQFSVMLLNCARLQWDIKKIVSMLDTGALDYARLMYEMEIAPEIGIDIDAKWNSLESFDPETTALLHYTDMNTQPWVSLSNPFGHVWVACLRRALKNGFISRQEIEREISLGHVRPSLLSQLDSDINDTITLPDEIKRLDIGYEAPYKKLQVGGGRPWTSVPSAIKWVARQIYYRSPLARIFR